MCLLVSDLDENKEKLNESPHFLYGPLVPYYVLVFLGGYLQACACVNESNHTPFIFYLYNYIDDLSSQAYNGHMDLCLLWGTTKQ